MIEGAIIYKITFNIGFVLKKIKICLTGVKSKLNQCIILAT